MPKRIWPTLPKTCVELLLFISALRISEENSEASRLCLTASPRRTRTPVSSACLATAIRGSLQLDQLPTELRSDSPPNVGRALKLKQTTSTCSDIPTVFRTKHMAGVEENVYKCPTSLVLQLHRSFSLFSPLFLGLHQVDFMFGRIGGGEDGRAPQP